MSLVVFPHLAVQLTGVSALNDQKLTGWFLNQGADPNAECGSGLDLTPLSIAVADAPFAVISLLFDRGGSIEHGQLLHSEAQQ